MKKNYKKPRVMFENLAFNTAIAACDYIYTTNEKCNTSSPDGKPFYDEEDTATIYIADMISCNSIFYCYHGPNPIPAGKFSNS